MASQKEFDLEKPTNGEPACSVVLLGPTSPSSREHLVKGLQDRFKLTADQAEALVRKAPVVVKRGITSEKAQSFVYHLERIGGRVRVDRISPEPPSDVAPARRPVPPERGAPRAAKISPEPYCPWEDIENLGFFRAFFRTVGQVLFRPTRFFSRMPVDRGLVHPLIFALVVGVLGGIFSLLYQFLMMQYLGSMDGGRGFGGFGGPMMIGSAIGLPILTVIVVFIISAILHLCLMIVRGNREGFEATFRVVAYAMSTQVFGIIPFLGGVIGGIWALVIQILGLRESHRISTGRAALAIFLPLLVIIVLLAVLAAVLIPVILKIVSEVVRNF
jgi:hypothetical protein